jgi:8-oxo-dGTP pyrophosphatase MutT (NUDIX family)
MESWIGILASALAQPLPGPEAQDRMAPSMRRPVAGDPLKTGSVLILVYPCNQDLYTVFIKRTEYDGIHSGQVSFPGGMFEAADVVPENTALRETIEETGISTNQVRMIGKLTALHIPVSNTNVFPFVAACTCRPAFRHDPEEVQYLIEVRLEELADPATVRSKTMVVAGNDLEVPYFDIQGETIWGATAMITSEFLEVVRRAGLRFRL